MWSQQNSFLFALPQFDNTRWKTALISEIKPHFQSDVFLESSSAVALCGSAAMVDLSVAKFENLSYIRITVQKKKILVIVAVECLCNNTIETTGIVGSELMSG